MKQIHIAPTPKSVNRENAMIQNRGTSTLRHPYMTEKYPAQKLDILFRNRTSRERRSKIEPGRTPLLQEMHACCCVFKDRRALTDQKINSGGAQSGFKLAGLRAEDFSTSLGPCEVRPSNSGPALRRCPQRPGRRYTFERACVVTLPEISSGTPYSPFFLRIPGFFYP
jgi:hypothetical protein